MKIKIIQGDDKNIIQTIKNEDESLVDLSSISAATFKVKNTHEGDEYVSLTLGAGVTVVADPKTATASAALQATLTATHTGNDNMLPGNYIFEFQFTDSTGKIRTPRGFNGEIGELEILADLDT